MKLWAIKQYTESANERNIDGIIGLFETMEESLEHIYDYLPEDVEFWKECKNNTMIWTNGIKRVVRYVTEIESGEILKEYRPLKPFVTNRVVN